MYPLIAGIGGLGIIIYLMTDLGELYDEKEEKNTKDPSKKRIRDVLFWVTVAVVIIGAVGTLWMILKPQSPTVNVSGSPCTAVNTGTNNGSISPCSTTGTVYAPALMAAEITTPSTSGSDRKFYTSFSIEVQSSAESPDFDSDSIYANRLGVSCSIKTTESSRTYPYSGKRINFFSADCVSNTPIENKDDVFVFCYDKGTNAVMSCNN